MSDPNSATPSPVPPVVAPSKSFTSALLGFLASGTFRRMVAFVVALVIPILNKKFAWELDPNVITGDLVLALGYITSSNINEAVQAHADAKVAAAQAAANPAPVLNG